MSLRIHIDSGRPALDQTSATTMAEASVQPGDERGEDCFSPLAMTGKPAPRSVGVRGGISSGTDHGILLHPDRRRPRDPTAGLRRMAGEPRAFEDDRQQGKGSGGGGRVVQRMGRLYQGQEPDARAGSSHRAVMAYDEARPPGPRTRRSRCCRTRWTAAPGSPCTTPTCRMATPATRTADGRNTTSNP